MRVCICIYIYIDRMVFHSYEGVYFVWGQDVARNSKGPPIDKQDIRKALYIFSEYRSGAP